MQKGFEKIAWLKSTLLIEHTGPAASVRDNSLRLHRAFKALLSNGFSQSVTVRHKFFLNIVVPVSNSILSDVVSSLTVYSFKDVLNRHNKRFGCYNLNKVDFHL